MQQMAQNEAESKGWPILEPMDVEGLPRPVAINKDVCVVGTRAEVNLKLSSPLVSRTHAIFVADRDSIYLRDLASRNHTYLNEKPIREAVLRNGDVIAVGPLSFRCKSGFDRPYDPADVHAPAAELMSVTDGKRIPIADRTTLIGSRDDCDVVLPPRGVEPSHAIIFEREGRRYLRDLRTVSGTWVNNNAVGQIELNDGDEIRIAQAQFVYQLTAPDQLEQEADLHPLAAEPAVAPAEFVDSDSDERVELELTDDTADIVPDSVGLSDWDATNLRAEGEPLLAAGADTTNTEETSPAPAPDDSLGLGTIPLESAPTTPPLATEGDVVSIRLEDLTEAPVAAPAHDETPTEPQGGPAGADLPPIAHATEPVTDEKPLESPEPPVMEEASELLPTAPIATEANVEEATHSDQPPADDVSFAVPDALEPNGIAADREHAEREAAPASPHATHPGQYDRPAPEEKLTELLDALTENIAEVQSTWQEVRAKQSDEPHRDHPGIAGERGARGSDHPSDDPDIKESRASRAASSPHGDTSAPPAEL